MDLNFIIYLLVCVDTHTSTHIHRNINWLYIHIHKSQIFFL
jgi:hypothetical protein